MTTVMLIVGSAIALYGAVLLLVAWRSGWSKSEMRLGAWQIVVGLLMVLVSTCGAP